MKSGSMQQANSGCPSTSHSAHTRSAGHVLADPLGRQTPSAGPPTAGSVMINVTIASVIHTPIFSPSPNVT